VHVVGIEWNTSTKGDKQSLAQHFAGQRRAPLDFGQQQVLTALTEPGCKKLVLAIAPRGPSPMAHRWLLVPPHSQVQDARVTQHNAPSRCSGELSHLHRWLLLALG
jgi:hypothetical protein